MVFVDSEHDNGVGISATLRLAPALSPSTYGTWQSLHTLLSLA